MRQKFSSFVIFGAILAETIVFSALASQFASVENLVNVALSIAVIGILAVGMTFIILTGGIDLSIGSVAALAGVVAAIVTQHTEIASLGFAAALGIGLASGAFNGVTIAYFRVPPFVVTLAVLTIARGLAFIFSGGRSIGNLPESFGRLGKLVFLGIPFSVWLMILAFALGWFLLRHTTFGRYVYAVGGNAEAAFLAGVKTKAVLFQVYVLNGFLVGLAAIVLASRLGAGVPNAGLQYELDVIAAVVVGGTSLSGGRGSVISTLFGAIFIGVLNNGLNLVGVDTYVQKIILGVVILLAVLADRFNRPD
ncbi:MAG: ABC transporter permease [Acidobacteria bacterium]|jgi:ribose/xylose/arabinose/galactoside ABC-type transport system permease subunit|nr:ABC transporter permease [Acidobacteriota bacterium]